jgi:hypothetical protein
MKRATIIVSGLYAYRSRRVAAARARELGLDIVTLPGLAARLCGGFVVPADRGLLVQLVSKSVAEVEFEELEPVRDRPGMARAVLSSLNRLWTAGIPVKAADDVPRLRDLWRVENYLREHLPIALLLPVDLAERAVKNVDRAAAILGPVHFERLIDIDPLWRPLIEALSGAVDVTWTAAGARDRSWFPGQILAVQTESRSLTCETCADPRAEVVEALRWARALLSDGKTQASDIAIVSADTSAWDDHAAVKPFIP